jgi:type I restriction enzyme S subunit
MRESGIEWLGKVPTHWSLKPLKCAVTFQRGHDLPLEQRTEGEFPVVSSAGISAWHNLAKAKGPGIVTGRYGTIGVFYLIDTDYWPLNTSLYSVDLHGNVPRYLCYMLHALADLFLLNSAKSAVPGVDRNDLHAITVAVPPVQEQNEIATILDRETAKIDALIAKKQRLIELLQEKRTALISHAVTKGLHPGVPMKESGVPWLGQVPEHWSGRKIKHLFRFTKRQDHADLTVLSVYRDHGVLEKSSRDDNHNRTPEDLTTYQLVNVGDLVINKMKAWQGSLGVATLTGITSPDYVVYESQNNENLRFIHHLLRTPLMASTYHTISNGIRPDQWRLEPEKFELVSVYLPPKEEQHRIVCVIEEEIRRIDLLSEKVTEAVEKLREYRTALISAAVTGKIDVREEAG